MPDLIRHPVFFLDSGQRTTLVRVRRNDKTAASRGECTQREFKNRDLINIATTTLAAKTTANEKAFFSPSVSSGLNVIRRFLNISNSDLRETFQPITNRAIKPIIRKAIPTYA
jgi:hypothetical protein